MLIIYFDYLFYCSVNVFHCLSANLLTPHIAICYHKTSLNSSLIWAIYEAKKTTIGELHLLPYFLVVVTFISHFSVHSWEPVAFSVWDRDLGPYKKALKNPEAWSQLTMKDRWADRLENLTLPYTSELFLVKESEKWKMMKIQARFAAARKTVRMCCLTLG